MNNRISLTKNTGLTLVEIIIAMLAFALITAGLANMFIATKQLGLHTRSRMTSGELAGYFLDRLQMHVRQDTWETPGNYLTVGTYRSRNDLDDYCPEDPLNPNKYQSYTTVSWLDEPGLGGISYYTAQRVEPREGIRKVTLTICWQEPTEPR